jgi:hypothetical protein
MWLRPKSTGALKFIRFHGEFELLMISKGIIHV